MRRAVGKSAVVLVLGALAVLAFGMWAFGSADTVVSQAPSSSVATENTVRALTAGIDEAETRGVFDTATANALIVFGGLQNAQPDSSSVKTAVNAEYSGGRFTESEGRLLLWMVATRIGSSTGETAAAVEARLRAAVRAPVNVAPTGLSVSRPGGGSSATLMWTPGSDAASQALVALQLADVAGTLKLVPVGAAVGTYEFTGLQTGTYLFFVVGYDANGNYKDASGNLYKDATSG